MIDARTHKIYVSRPKYWKDLPVNPAKVGQTIRAPKTRVGEGDTEYTLSEIEILAEFEVPAGVTDRRIHAELERMGYGRARKDKVREMFSFPGEDPKEVVSTAINNIRYGVSRSDSYSMRQEQRECVQKALAAFKSGFTDFLIAACPRFGKSFTSLNILKAEVPIGGVGMLTSERLGDVEDSWLSTVQNHVLFEDFNVIFAKDGKQATDSLKRNLVIASSQYLKNDTDNKSWLYDLHYSALVVDEEHWGGHTELVTEIIKRLNPSKTLWLSGTAYKSLESGKFAPENTFQFSYLDSLRSEHPLPRVITKIVEFSDELKKEVAKEGYTEDDAFNISKIFRLKSDSIEFKHNVARKILEALFDETPVSQKTMYLSLFEGMDIHPYSLEHIFLKGPKNVKQCKALVKYLKHLLPGYKVFLCAGDGPDAIKTATAINKEIRENKRTLVVTCGRFTTGITQPKWGTIVLLDDSQSLEEYMQTLFRGATPYSTPEWEKSVFYLVDLNPHRSIYIRTRQIFEEHKRSTDKSFEEIGREYNKVAPMHVMTGAGMKVVDMELVHKSLLKGNRSILDKFNSLSGIISTGLDQDCKFILETVSSKASGQKQNKVPLGDEDLEKGKNSNQVSPKSSNPESKKEKKKYLEALKELKARIPMGSLISGAENLDDLLKMEARLFEEIFGILPVHLKELLGKVFNKEQINEDITRFRSMISLAKESPESLWPLINFYCSSGDACPGTPEKLANEMVKELIASVLPPSDELFFDPFVANGSIFIKTAELLDIALEQVFPDRAERMGVIFGRLLVGADSSKAAVAFTKRLAQSRFGLDELDIEPRIWYYNNNSEFLEGMTKMKKEAKSKRWAVVGNPPYQRRDKGVRTGSATAIYHDIINSVRAQLNPELEMYVIPARWLANAGKGLNDFRVKMLEDKSIQRLKVYTSSEDCFPPPTSIKGGVLWYLRNSGYHGKCSTSVFDGGFEDSSLCYLDEDGTDSFNPNSITRGILGKVASRQEPSLKDRVSARKPFGLTSGDTSNVATPDEKRDTKLYQLKTKRSPSIGYIDSESLTKGKELVDKYKVLVSKACEGKGGLGLSVITPPIIAEPGSACTETYIIIDSFDTLEEALKLKSYLSTRLVRFLISTRKVTHNASRNVYVNVPDISQEKNWTDEELYKKYALTEEEINFVEKKVKAFK